MVPTPRTKRRVNRTRTWNAYNKAPKAEWHISPKTWVCLVIVSVTMWFLLAALVVAIVRL